MAKSVKEVMGGIFCCMEQEDDNPWCNDCPYENIFNCKNILRNDIAYHVMTGKLEVGDDGKWQLAGCDKPPKRKEKRKHGKRYFDGKKHQNHGYEDDEEW